jgi:hypothetical protein
LPNQNDNLLNQNDNAVTEMFNGMTKPVIKMFKKRKEQLHQESDSDDDETSSKQQSQEALKRDWLVKLSKYKQYETELKDLFDNIHAKNAGHKCFSDMYFSEYRIEFECGKADSMSKEQELKYEWFEEYHEEYSGAIKDLEISLEITTEELEKYRAIRAEIHQYLYAAMKQEKIKASSQIIEDNPLLSTEGYKAFKTVYAGYKDIKITKQEGDMTGGDMSCLFYNM